MGIAANIRVEKNGKRMDVIGEFYDKPPVFVTHPSNVYGIHGTDYGYMLIHAPNRQTILDDKDCIAWFVTRSLSIAAELSFDFDGDYAEITQEDFLHDISEQKQRLEKFHPKVLGCDSINSEFDRDTFTKIFSDFIMRSDAVYDYVEEAMEGNGFIGDFHIWRNHEEEVFFCHMPSGTIVSWYKWNHIGRANWANKTMTSNDLEAFFKVLRLDVIDEIKDKPEYFEKPDMFRQHKKMTEEEIRKAMDKLNRNTIYGGLVNPDKEVRRIDKALANGISPLDPASLYPDIAIYGSPSEDIMKYPDASYIFPLMLNLRMFIFNKMNAKFLGMKTEANEESRKYIEQYRVDDESTIHDINLTLVHYKDTNTHCIELMDTTTDEQIECWKNTTVVLNSTEGSELRLMMDGRVNLTIISPIIKKVYEYIATQLEAPTSTDDTDKPKTMYKFAAMALEKVCSYFNKLDSEVLIKRNDDDVFLRVYKVDGHRIDVREEGAFINVDDVSTGESLIFDEFIARYVNSSESLKIKFSDFALGKSDIDKLKTLPIVSNVLKDFLLNIYDALYDFT